MQQPDVNLRPADSNHLHYCLRAGDSGSRSLFTPAPSTTDSEGRGSLPSSASNGSIRGFLCSPTEPSSSMSANISGGSLHLGSFVTPKRKLSMDLDESTQDASDSGYSRGASLSISSHESLSAALDEIIKEPTSNHSTRTPLGDVTNSVIIQGRQKHSEKAKRSISFPAEDKSKKMPTSTENQEPTHVRISSLPSLPPLPYSPLSRDSAQSRKNSLQQINSPLERMTLRSPGVHTPTSQKLYRSGDRLFMFPSLPAREHSVESDGYSESEVFDGEESSSNTNSLPSGLTTLMNARFTTDSGSSKKEAPFSLCKPPTHSTPMVQYAAGFTLTRAESWSFQTTSHSRRGSLKRASPCPESSEQPKKKKPPLPVFDSKSQDTPNLRSPLKGVQLLRSQSCSLGVVEHSNMFPLSPGSDNGEMIGDHTKMYALPLCKKTSVPDLKCVSPQTLAELLEDNCSGEVDEYIILDCRYPYEYKGGHIRGAENVWSKETLQEQFFSKPEYMLASRRRIVIFHCEFSSKRGPDMSRFMRKLDRKKNDVAFPRLYYPELYLLEGGYKAFYEQYPNLCEPNCYIKMLDDRHKEELRHFKQRSKSWTAGGDASMSKRRGSHLRPRRSTIDSHITTRRKMPSKS